jgi:hypothetical protein
LDTFALPDVLALLATTAKSGELDVSGPAGGGQLWLERGQVVGALSVGAADVVDVLVGLLRLDEGDFAFHADRPAPAPGTPTDVSVVLERAEARLAEWREVEQVLPSATAFLTLVPTASGSVRLSRDQWTAVVAIGDGRLVDELVERLGGEELTRWRLLAGLVEAGLAEVGTPVAVAPSTVAPVQRTELAQQLSTLTVAALTEDVSEPVRAAVVPGEDDDDDDGHVAIDVAEIRSDDEDGNDEPEGAEPLAAEPVSAAAPAHPTEPPDAVSRGTLLKFLSSVRT